MVFPVVGGDGKPTGYEISNSLRFNSSDTARLGKTISGTSNRKTFSMSFWLKKTKLSGNGGIFGVGTASSDTGKLQIRIDGSDNLKIEGGATTYRVTDREFRDVSAWYNIFISFDSTQSTADNRILIYVNGVQETSFSTSNNPSQDANTPFNEDGKTHYIGTEGDGSSAALDGYLAEFHYIDGTKKAYTDFGEFDDNGVWIPKKYDGSYGTHGFYFQFKQTGTSANSSGMGADTSGNDNHYTPNNLAAIDVTTDTPTNNFIIWNALNHTGNSLQEGNTFTETRNSSDYDAGAMGNIGLTRGKWYWELKITAVGSHTYAGIINIGNRFNMADEDYDTTSGGIDGYPIYDYMELGKRGSNTGSGRSETGVVQATYGDGDILNFALDLDNNKIHYGKNGTYGESSDPANNTNGIAISDGVYYTPVVVGYGSGDIHANFGQPAFSISSGNSDANGYGNFEYAVPSGYYSICTKNLAEYG
jgi:hypothetical protein